MGAEDIMLEEKVRMVIGWVTATVLSLSQVNSHTSRATDSIK